MNFKLNPYYITVTKIVVTYKKDFIIYINYSNDRKNVNYKSYKYINDVKKLESLLSTTIIQFCILNRTRSENKNFSILIVLGVTIIYLQIVKLAILMFLLV